MTCIPARGAAVDALFRAAAIGPYFSVDTAPAADEPWRPLTDLLHDPAVVDERVSAVRAALALRARVPAARLDVRACASIHVLGLASRLLAPSLAAASLDGVVVSTAPENVRWQRTDGGPVPIAWTDAVAHPAGDAQHAARLLHRHVVEPLIAPLVAAFARVSPLVLWGNVASAAVGAVSMLRSAGATFALDPVQVLTALLEHGSLTGTGRLDVPDRGFVRASCCLFYRIPNAGKCGDCVLLGPRRRDTVHGSREG